MSATTASANSKRGWALALALGLVPSCEPGAPAATADASAAPGADVPAVEPPPPPQPSYSPMGCAHRVWIPDAMTDFVRDDRSTFGPDATPRNVHVTWPASPSSTIAMVWKTDAATRASVVQYGAARDRLERTATGHVMTSRSAFGELTQHETHLCGLTPDTTYYYRVGGEGHWSEVQRFKTAPMAGQRGADVNFAVSGDSRDDFRIWRMLQERALSVSGARQPDFEVFTGDAVPFGPIQADWDQWFEGAAPTMALMPFAIAHGNHEALSINYLMQFAQPQVGRPDQDELYFSFDYGPIHFVFVNDTPYRADYEQGFRGSQLAWIRADLTAHRARRMQIPWLVAVHHKSAFSSSNHTDDADTAIVRATLPPVYEEFGVDVVLNGHDHEFEVSKPLDGQGREVPTGRRGTVHYIAGGAGASLNGADTRPWSRYHESVNNFMLVHATERVLEVTPYRGDGTVITQGRTTLTPRMP